MADGGEKQIVVLLSAAPAPGDGKGKSAAQRRRSSGTVGTLTACLRSESGESHTVLWNTDALFEDSNNKRAGEHSKSAGKGSLLKGRLNHFPRVRDIQFMGKGRRPMRFLFEKRQCGVGHAFNKLISEIVNGNRMLH